MQNRYQIQRTDLGTNIPPTMDKRAPAWILAFSPSERRNEVTIRMMDFLSTRAEAPGACAYKPMPGSNHLIHQAAGHHLRARKSGCRQMYCMATHLDIRKWLGQLTRPDSPTSSTTSKQPASNETKHIAAGQKAAACLGPICSGHAAAAYCNRSHAMGIWIPLQIYRVRYLPASSCDHTATLYGPGQMQKTGVIYQRVRACHAVIRLCSQRPGNQEGGRVGNNHYRSNIPGLSYLGIH